VSVASLFEIIVFIAGFGFSEFSRMESTTFATLLVGVTVITSGLTLLPALALGPVVEGLG
jgi:K+-transporting ATPase A subunit